jgi:acylphosphatase
MTDPTAQCIQCIVTGRVQGVFYRASAKERADALGITGYAKNRPDGRVEVQACGSPEALAIFRSWLASGPPDARVEDVDCAEAPGTPPAEFMTR